MWLATRTRPDISATLGILASQMVIRPKYVHGCLNNYGDTSLEQENWI